MKHHIIVQKIRYPQQYLIIMKALVCHLCVPYLQWKYLCTAQLGKGSWEINTCCLSQVYARVQAQQ